MSAIINVGWQPSGNEWLRKGDYLTETHYRLEEVKDEETTIEKDLVVRLYE